MNSEAAGAGSVLVQISFLCLFFFFFLNIRGISSVAMMTHSYGNPAPRKLEAGAFYEVVHRVTNQSGPIIVTAKALRNSLSPFGSLLWKRSLLGLFSPFGS